MRETTAHARFLFLFAKTVIADTFKKKSPAFLMLSEYMSINLEAYAVLTYANNYHCWLEEATRSNGGGGGAGEVSDVTDPSTSNDISKRSKRLFTETTTRGDWQIQRMVRKWHQALQQD